MSDLLNDTKIPYAKWRSRQKFQILRGKCTRVILAFWFWNFIFWMKACQFPVPAAPCLVFHCMLDDVSPGNAWAWQMFTLLLSSRSLPSVDTKRIVSLTHNILSVYILIDVLILIPRSWCRMLGSGEKLEWWRLS